MFICLEDQIINLNNMVNMKILANNKTIYLTGIGDKVVFQNYQLKIHLIDDGIINLYFDNKELANNYLNEIIMFLESSHKVYTFIPKNTIKEKAICLINSVEEFYGIEPKLLINGFEICENPDREKLKSLKEINKFKNLLIEKQKEIYEFAIKYEIYKNISLEQFISEQGRYIKESYSFTDLDNNDCINKQKILDIFKQYYLSELDFK